MKQQLSVRLCLIDVKVPGAYGGTPLNLLALGSYLVHRHVLRAKDIKIINSDKKNALERAILFKPTIVGLSVVTPAYPYAVKLARYIKKRLPSAVIVIGGHHITGIPSVFAGPFDIGVLGEGEGALEDIVRAAQQGVVRDENTMQHIPNLVYKTTDGVVHVAPMRPLLEPEDIPSTAWELLEKEEIVRYETVVEEGRSRPALSASLFSSRGCPYQCVFCARTVIWKTGAGFRLLPLDHVVKDIVFLYKTFHITSLWIFDDTFAVSKERIRQLIAALRKNNILGNIVFPQVFVRANLIDQEFALLLKELGVLTVFIGIESGSPKILRYLKNGSLETPQVKRAIQIFAGLRIRIVGSFMLFVPGETKADLDKTYKLVRWFSSQPNAHAIGMYVTVPFPGTKLWEDTVGKSGRLPHNIQWKDFITYHSKTNIARVVFFRNRLTDRELNYYWNRVQKEMGFIEHKVKQLPGWRDSEKTVDMLNKQLDARLEMKHRLERIMHNPKRIAERLLNKRVWQYVLNDLKRLITHS